MTESIQFNKKEWWRILDVTWKRIFKKAIDINHNPTDEELIEILSLETIDISSNPYVISLEPLQNLKKLRKLNCSRTKIRTLEKIQHLNLIDELDCSFSEVNSLEPLKNLQSIWYLNCSNTKIKSLRGLEKLNELAHLNCSDTTITDIIPLSKLQKLKSVNCDNTRLSELNAFTQSKLEISFANTPLEQENIAEDVIDERDALFEDAARLILIHGEAKGSLIQRKLKLGYNRTCRILDQLEAAKIIGPFLGTREREVLIKDEETLNEILNTNISSSIENQTSKDAFEHSFISNHKGNQSKSDKEDQTRNRNLKVLACALLVVIILITIGLIRQGNRQAETNTNIPDRNASTEKSKIGIDKHLVTINGFDLATNSIIDPINLWGNYETRTLVGQVHHGEKVYFIKREGEGICIETKSGIKGWVTYFFISEFNDQR